MVTVKLAGKPVVYTSRKKKETVLSQGSSKINPVLIIKLTQELISHSVYYSKQT